MFHGNTKAPGFSNPLQLLPSGEAKTWLFPNHNTSTIIRLLLLHIGYDTSKSEGSVYFTRTETTVALILKLVQSPLPGLQNYISLPVKMGKSKMLFCVLNSNKCFHWQKTNTAKDIQPAIQYYRNLHTTMEELPVENSDFCLRVSVSSPLMKKRDKQLQK